MEGIQLYDAQGKETGTHKLEVAALKKDAHKAYACAIKTLLQNWRQGTVACKSRGMVSFSGKKPWRQKGTGRARAGMASSPLWRKGGVIFGPQPRTKTLKMPRSQKTFVLYSIFAELYNKGAIYCLDFDTHVKSPQTKNAFNALKKVGLENKKVVLFLPPHDTINTASFRNISNVYMLYFDQPNAYDISRGECWVFLKKDMDLFNKMVAQWNSIYTTS